MSPGWLRPLPRNPGRIPTHPQLVSRRLSPTCRDAMPKSAIRMLFLSSSSRFSGFKSLWLGSKGQMSLNAASTHSHADEDCFLFQTPITGAGL